MRFSNLSENPCLEWRAAIGMRLPAKLALDIVAIGGVVQALVIALVRIHLPFSHVCPTHG
jgi:hypothetical protein